MRPVVLWLIGLLGIVAEGENLYAQVEEPFPMVSLDMRQVPLLDVLKEIERQTGLFFSYESSLLDGSRRVSLSVRDESLSNCLDRLFLYFPIDYEMTERYIILKRKLRQYTISGFVRDSDSHEYLLGASILSKELKRGTISNNYGFYSLTFPEGKVCLRVSYVGFKAKEVEIDLRKDTMMDFSLRSFASLGEVVIKGIRPRFEVMNGWTGVADISSERVKSMPALLGEADLVKTLHQLPGVAVGTEGMTGLYVRGGNADENLFLLDGNPVYHVNHLLGFFSAFNPDAVKNIRFYKGGFPAEYGGRLSSVVDVRMNDGDRQEYHGNVSVGLLSARANLEGPIVKGRSSFNVAVRRTWMDLFMTPILSILNKDEENKETFGYHFFDINAKVNHSFSERSRVYASFYMGQDAFRRKNELANGDADERFLWRWGNLIVSGGWNYVFSPKLFGNLMVGYSRFRSHIRQEANGYEISGKQVERRSYRRESRYKSEMEDMSVRFSLDYRPSVAHRVRMGLDYLFHDFRPENSRQRSWLRDSLDYAPHELFHDYSRIKGHEFSLFAEDDIRLTDRVRMNVGTRYTLFHVEDEIYHSFQPRFSMRYLFRRGLSAKVSYSEMSQYVHLLSNTYVNQPTDIWVPVTRKVPPMRSRQVTAGLYYNWRRVYDFSIEGYYKRMKNLIDYKDHWPVEAVFSGWEDRVGLGKGRAYGVELLARKTEGKTTGWVGYTLSWSDRWFPDGSVNKGRRFPFRFDNRHKVDVVVSRWLSPKVELTGAWVFASGNHISLPEYKYLPPSAQKGNGYTSGDAYLLMNSGLSARNNYQLAPYHRLDVGVNIYQRKKMGRMGVWNLSLYNVYWKPNPFMTEVVTYRDGATGQYRARLEETILFYCLPSVSYTYKF